MELCRIRLRIWKSCLNNILKEQGYWIFSDAGSVNKVKPGSGFESGFQFIGAGADSDSKKAESVTLVLKRLIAIETEEASNEGIQTNWGSLWRIFLRMTQRLGSLRILLITN